jgi:hypothetical protein
MDAKLMELVEFNLTNSRYEVLRGLLDNCEGTGELIAVALVVVSQILDTRGIETIADVDNMKPTYNDSAYMKRLFRNLYSAQLVLEDGLTD